MYRQKNEINVCRFYGKCEIIGKTSLPARVADFLQNRGPESPPPLHEVGRVQYRAQHSFLGPVSSPAVYLFSIRLPLPSPA